MRSREAQPAVSRRNFLRGAGLAAASAVASTSAAAQADGETVTVEMTDELVFDPDEIRIAPGTTVVWENVGTVGHSVTAYEEEIPDEADFFSSGDLPSEQAARNRYPQEGDVAGGESYSHTFEVEGEYGYFCIPHESAGMLGTVLVTTEPAEPSGPTRPTVPDSARSLALAATTALLSTLTFAYVFMRYGGDYGVEE